VFAAQGTQEWLGPVPNVLKIHMGEVIQIRVYRVKSAMQMQFRLAIALQELVQQIQFNAFAELVLTETENSAPS
jgi:hypothetical protein